jgi:hypothetical protein
MGEEVHVSTYTTGYQDLVQTTALANGGWVVTWDSDGQDGDEDGVYQRVYNANGDALGEESRVNTLTSGDQYAGGVSALANGGWVVTWTSFDGSYDVYQRAYNADGEALGKETRINTYATGDQDGVVITALSDGGWVAAWDSNGQDGDSYGVYQQRYDADGQVYGSNHAPMAADTAITALTNGDYTFSKKAMHFSDGNDGDHLASVKITSLPSAGKLLLDGVAVTRGQVIAADDLADLVWQAGRHALSATLKFRVTDDGGTEAGGKDTSLVHSFKFAIASDTFTATKDADRLRGTDGHDILIGRHGDDRLTGGAGADTFVFQTGDGRDKITDFHPGQGDKIDLSAVDGIASYKDLIHNHISDGRAGLRITDGDGDTIILMHTSAGDLHKGDFVF